MVDLVLLLYLYPILATALESRINLLFARAHLRCRTMHGAAGLIWPMTLACEQYLIDVYKRRDLYGPASILRSVRDVSMVG